MLAKSKINSIESLMSQELIHLDISHEEFKTIVNEKEKYGQVIIVQAYTEASKKCNDGVNRLEKEKQRENFRTILGFKEHHMKVTEKTTLDSIKNAFKGENIQTHYRSLEYEINLYFHDYKLAVEIDEKDHLDRDMNRERERQKALEKEVGCKFISINPDINILIFLRLRMNYVGT